MTPSVTPAAASADDWFTPGRFLALLALCLFAAFPEVVLGSHTFYYRDFGHFAYPLAQYHRECFWRGEIPLWNPYSSCGLPFLAQWNTMCLYPGSLIYLLGPMPWALGGFSLAHLLLAGAGAYRLALHWTGNRFAASVAGLAFAFNGFTLHAVMWPNNVAALAWAPWLWLLLERGCKEGGRTFVLAALVGAMQMLAGAPEIILFTWGIAGVLRVACCVLRDSGQTRPAALTQHATRNTQLLRFVAIAALVFLLSAAQLLPFLDLLQHSHRSAAFDAGHDTMPVSGLVNFLVPLFQMTPDRNGVFTQLNQQWTSSYYPGLGVLALAVLAVWQRREPRVRLLAAIGVLGVWLAMGDNAYLLGWLKTLCPPLGFIRFPVKYVLLPLMVLPFLVAIGWKAIEDEPRASEVTFQRILIALLLIVVVPLGRTPEFFESSPRTGPLSQWFLNSVWRTLGFLGLIGVAFAQIRSSPVPPRRILLLVALIAVLALDILTHAPRQNPTVVPHAYAPGIAKFHTPMPRLGEGRALLTREMEGFMSHASNPDALNYVIGARRALFANWNLIEGVPKANGFFSLFPRELAETWQLLYGFGYPFPERFADFLGITRASSSDALFTWAHRTNALPLVTAGQQPTFADATNTLRAIAAADFNPAQVVYLPAARAGDLQSPSVANESTERRLQTAGTTNAARVVSSKWSAHRIECEVEAAAPSQVVIAQTFYNPWRTTVNGQPAEILRANHAFQAVPVPAGCSTVRLEYVDRAFQLGLALSALGLLACAVLWWRARPTSVGDDVRSLTSSQEMSQTPNVVSYPAKNP